MTSATFDPKTRAWTADGGGIAIEGVAGEVKCDPASLADVSYDFGGIVHSKPAALLRAKDAADVAKALAFCNAHDIPVVARAFGQSGNGEAQHDGALIIDMRALDTIYEMSSDRISVGAGADWRTLAAAGAKAGWVPPVITNHPDVSIGGSTTIGGLGVTSHRHGLQADNLIEIDVAMLDGKIHTCSEHENQDLFRAVRGGLGQYGFVTRVSMVSIPVPDRVAVTRVYYDDLRTMLDATFALARENRVDMIDNLTRMARPEHNETSAHYNDLGYFLYDGGAMPDMGALAGRGRGRPEETRMFEYLPFVHMQEDYIQFITHVPIPKPWFACFLPERNVERFIEEHARPLLDWPTHNTIALLTQPLTSRMLRNALPLPRGRDEWLGAVGLVRIKPPPAVPGALEEHTKLVEAVLSLGGTTYPYGTVPLTPELWPRLFGERWEEVRARKRKYDPKGLVNPSIRIGEAALR